MRKKWVSVGKRITAVVLAAAMVAGGAQISGTKAVKADTGDEENIIYAVDCGDLTPNVAEDEIMGSCQSVSEQLYGEDPETNKKWGLIDEYAETNSSLSNPSGKTDYANAIFTTWSWPWEYAADPANNTTYEGTIKKRENSLRYSRGQDNKTPKKFSYQFELEKGDYKVEVGYSNMWNNANESGLLTTVYDSEEEVKVEETEVVAESTIGASKTENGVQPFCSGTKETVVTLDEDGFLKVTPFTTSNCLLVTHITITEIADPDQEIVDSVVAGLSVPVTTTANLTLPVTGANGSEISWSSDQPDVIANDGTVTRPSAATGNVDVELTATVTKGEASEQKTFTVTVLATADQTEDDGITNAERVIRLSFEDDINDDMNNITATESGTIAYGKGVAGGKCLSLTGNGCLDLGTSKELQPSKLSVSFWFKATKAWADEQVIMWSKPDGAYDGEGWYLSANQTDDCLELVLGNSKGAQPYKLCANTGRNEYFPVGEWVHTVVTWDSDEGTGSIYRNGVKQQTSIMNAAADHVIRATNDHKYLGDNSPAYWGGLGTFDLDEYEIFNGILSASDAAKLYIKNGGTIDTEDLAQKDFLALTIPTEVTSDISLPKEGTKGASDITWESKNKDVISDAGKVTRPASGEDDAKVKLIATITNGETVLTKEFEVTVLAKSALSNLESFDLDEVNVLDSYYDNVTKKDVAFLNTFDPDRLLYNFRLTAGYTKAEIQTMDFEGKGKGATTSYIGWENSRIGGHTMGHYLAAMAQAVAHGYGAEKGKDGKSIEERLNYLIDQLDDCQNKLGTGYIFGATLEDVNEPEKQFDILETKSTTGTWVPWYTMHKIVNGLVETYKLTDNKKALTVAEKLAGWIYQRTQKWDEATRKYVLGVEYGGMNDCLYELYTYAKKDGYENIDHIAAAAHEFDEDELFKRVLDGEKNLLNNRHANCTIPKFIGALNRYRTLKSENVEGVDDYLEYAKAFWELVVNHHTYITGGNSECEYFGADDILDKERSNCNCETCNTHNMLKLSKWLYEITGDKKYADYYETTFINAIMASVNEETGMTTYFQPMATGLYKVYCNSDIENNEF